MTDRHSPNKLISSEEAVAAISSGSSLAVGGVVLDNKPLALERAIIRAGIRDLKYFGLAGCGYDIDLLAAANGVVSETFVPVVTFEELGLAPSFRWAVEDRRIVAHMVDVATLMAGYFAGASGLPFHPVTAIRGSDVTRLNPLVSYVEWQDAGKIPVVAAITPDVALIHVQESDCRGNARVFGATAQGERFLARAAKRVIISCDRILPTASFEQNPHTTTIPGMYVDAVCHLPLGTHPTGSQTICGPDMPHVRKYWGTAEKARQSKNHAPMRQYLERYVHGCRSHEDYLNAVGGSEIARLILGEYDVRSENTASAS
jgi:glutaconate CoA-transferase, subunit A